MLSNTATKDAKREAYLQKTEARIDEWNAELSKLKAKAAQAKAQAKIEYFKQIEILDAHMEEAQKKFAELQMQGGEAWKELRAGVDRAIEELGAAVERARAHLD